MERACYNDLDMPGKCAFNELWLEKSEYQRWLAAVSTDVYKFRCKLCRCTLELACMGESALTSHMKGKFF